MNLGNLTIAFTSGQNLTTLTTQPTIPFTGSWPSTGGGGCSYHVEGDGYCDDFNNNVLCNFDGGDCCLVEVKTDFCISCECLEDTNIPDVGMDCLSYSDLNFDDIYNDGICHDTLNHPDCNFDGNDCCHGDTTTNHCTSCICYEEFQLGKKNFLKVILIGKYAKCFF